MAADVQSVDFRARGRSAELHGVGSRRLLCVITGDVERAERTAGGDERRIFDIPRYVSITEEPSALEAQPGCGLNIPAAQNHRSGQLCEPARTEGEHTLIDVDRSVVGKRHAYRKGCGFSFVKRAEVVEPRTAREGGDRAVRQYDLDGNLKWVREAGRMADWVLVSFHCHEGGKTRDEPPEFLTTFARSCIDAGAHAFIGHGPHVTRGIEIYKGRPIFYSLGNFIFQNDTVRWQPSYNYDFVKLDSDATPADFYDARSEKDSRGFLADSVYWESVVARCKYSGGELEEVRLLPIDLGFGRRRSQRGRPLLAGAKVGEKVLERMARLSKPLGTAVTLDNGVGVVRL